MITFKIKPKGILLLATRGDRDALVAQLLTDCWIQALIEYVTGTMPSPGVSILERFSPEAFSSYGFSQRSDSYIEKQKKAFGQARPFYSPRIINFAKLAQVLTGPSLGRIQSALRDLARQSSPHLKDQITKPGIGYRIRVQNTKRKVRVTLVMPAARPLNANPSYAKEFRDLSRGHSGQRIRQRAKALYARRMPALMHSGGDLGKARVAA